MSHRVIALCLATLASLASPAAAVIGTADDVPAATLLLPYFEVDQANPNGITTLLTVRNADSAPVVAHVTIWSNLSVPLLDFDVYLTGFDQQTINLRDVLVSGLLPRTGPSDILSPRGARSGPHSTFGGTCSASPGVAPNYNNPALTASLLSYLQSALTGGYSTVHNGCVATHTDNLVGYVTVDAVNKCNLFFPTDVNYFVPGGQGIASNRNVLWGDWFLVDPSTNLAQGDTLVHIEASADDPRTSTPGSYTFYGRYVGGSAADNRERLPSRWNAPLDPLVDPTAGQPAQVLVWRDSGRVATSFPCGSLPSTFPLGSTEISSISEDGLSAPLAADLFSAETQRTVINVTGSWLRLDLDTSTGSIFDPAKQAYVIALDMTPSATTGMGAIQGAGTGAIGTADAAPGASLLLPYFEVDRTSSSGVRTALAVRNGGAAPVLARVVLWTDLSVPTLGFHVYLPAFGSRVVDLQEIFATGWLPASGPAPLPGCSGLLPPAPLSVQSLTALNAAHTGTASQLFGGLCAGSSYGDGIARGYATVDVVTQCTAALPGQPGYFGATGVAGYDNVLWGEYAMVEPANNLAHGDALVHLQASTTNPLTSISGQPTFYGRYVNWTAADHREALPASWGVSSRRGGAFDGGSRLLVWRDSGQVHQPFACASSLATFPMSQGLSLHFDDYGKDVPVPSLALGLESQKRLVDWEGPSFGWIDLDLGTRTGAFTQPPLQAYATSLERAEARFGISISGVQLLKSQVIFADGFESGGLLIWSSAVP
ncbi:MAG TPA: hypothetical protein VJ725_33215 [Thermoanaerobaculia bacterium]|nr:hypothetical protein [Thermoanaerobaculia bacterium]